MPTLNFGDVTFEDLKFWPPDQGSVTKNPQVLRMRPMCQQGLFGGGTE